MQPTEYPSPHPSLSKRVGEPTVAATSTQKRERQSLEPVFGLSVLGYCRNMAVQYGGLRGRGPAPHVAMKGSF